MWSGMAIVIYLSLKGTKNSGRGICIKPTEIY